MQELVSMVTIVIVVRSCKGMHRHIQDTVIGLQRRVLPISQKKKKKGSVGYEENR